MISVVLKPQREKSLLRRHPWVFSGAIAKIHGSPQPGETVDIVASDGKWCGSGAFSPHSQITVRIWTFDRDEEVSPSLFRSRLQRAVKSRLHLLEKYATNACRLVNSESDFLPGLIVDQYSDFLVCQFLSAGAEYWKQTIVGQLSALIPNKGIYERSDVNAREKEGLPEHTGLLCGQEPPELVEIREGLNRFLVDIRYGHKTGFYLDQRDNRTIVTEYAGNSEILNCFSYTGGFAVAALKGGSAGITNIDSSADALKIGLQNIILNGLDDAKVINMEGDVFTVMRQYRDSNRRFDSIILDPPKFAASRGQLMRACRGYKDINLLAIKLLRPGGILFTFSCSGLVDKDLFQKIVADAALDAGRESQIIRWLHQATDHPTSLNFPEGSYLKGLLCRVW
ncbi:MAG: 23S rRNA (cytosine(1962)-C(5))-methyltransferase RlmI [Nitrospiraceae bacterium]|nr:MAG: 23S rRNA (cytosine(1962)-C(5))-methyltransferase RlmI [Nitrospiraceae bacterium]